VKRIKVVDETLLVENSNSVFANEDEFRMRNDKLLTIGGPDCKRTKATTQPFLQFLHVHTTNVSPL
jgi:hypothetical protein